MQLGADWRAVDADGNPPMVLLSNTKFDSEKRVALFRVLLQYGARLDQRGRTVRARGGCGLSRRVVFSARGHVVLSYGAHSLPIPHPHPHTELPPVPLRGDV